MIIFLLACGIGGTLSSILFEIFAAFGIFAIYWTYMDVRKFERTEEGIKLRIISFVLAGLLYAFFFKGRG